MFTQYFYLCLSELTIGFEQASYTTQEGTPVEVCALLLEGLVEQVNGVTFTFGAQPGTAGKKINASAAMPH